MARWGEEAVLPLTQVGERTVCGALVGTLSNKKEFPTTTSSSEVADHRELFSVYSKDRIGPLQYALVNRSESRRS